MLAKSDCLFVPAFYYYSFTAKGENGRPAILVNIHYKGNSELLRAFYETVENGMLE